MIGAIIGDIVGSRFEFHNIKTTDFELFTPDCSFTDDTICTIAIADSILQNRDFGQTLHEWCNRYPHPKGGYGGSFAVWVHSNDPIPYNSFGNGSAMRVSPCGYFANRRDVLVNARHSAECTHNHPSGIKGAVCIADCVHLALSFPHKGKIMDLVTKYGYDVSSPCDEIRKYNTFDETCDGTIPQSIRCFYESDDFESAIRLAVSIGGDSDTIAAITGSIAGAYYGIPENICETALSFLDYDMISVITKFGKKYG